jgi:hypothetical protein
MQLQKTRQKDLDESPNHTSAEDFGDEENKYGDKGNYMPVAQASDRKDPNNK